MRIREVTKNRPEFTIEEFCSHWQAHETETALAVRKIAIDELGIPAKVMFYPDDPFVLVLDGDRPGDSLDSIELLMGLEEHFHIKIPDEEAEKFFQLTFEGVVRYIMDKSHEITRRPAG